MRKIWVALVLFALLTLPATAYELAFAREASQGPFHLTYLPLGGNLVQLTVSPDGNYGDACATITYDTTAPPQIGYSSGSGWIYMNIVIGVPAPIDDLWYCCEFAEQVVSQRLAWCTDGKQGCCGASCSNCCKKYTLDHCWFSQHSDYS